MAKKSGKKRKAKASGGAKAVRPALALRCGVSFLVTAADG
jgi:hypothetical protein